MGTSWADHKKKKIIVLKCCLLLFYATTMKHFSIGLWHEMKSGLYITASDDQLSSVAGMRSSKALPKAKVKWSRSVMSNSLRPHGPPGSSVHGILQARILEWVAISFSRGSSQPKDRTQASCIAGRCFNLWATREAPTCPQRRSW